MWLIDFAPVAGARLNEIVVDEANPKTLWVNADPHDFSAILVNEGDSYPASAIPGASAWLRSAEVTLWEGKMRLCAITPKAPADAPEHIRHPDPVEITVGRVPHPIEGYTPPEPVPAPTKEPANAPA